MAPLGPPVPGSSGPGSSSAGSSKQQRGAAQPQQQLPLAQATAAEARRLQQALPRTPDGQLSACPPCPVPVPVTCVGGHCTVQVPCSSATTFSCQQPCGRPLACGNHACQAGCHDPAGAPCTPCSLPCQRQRDTCAHACPLRCHPASQACPPCEVATKQPCHCGKTTLGFACCEVTAEALPAARLGCGKTCHRALPACPHTCERECHPGACSSQGCTTEVTVRCSCKRNKKKLACSEVQRLLLAATGSAAYDGSAALRLLPCDAACASKAPTPQEPPAAAAANAISSSSDNLAAVSAAGASSDGAGSGARRRPAALSAAHATGAAAAGEEQPKRKLSREEKAREWELQRQKKAAAQQRKQLLRFAVLAALLGVALLLALGVRHLLLVADRKAQAAWGRQQL